ncbi:peptidase M20 domain-containing protein 2-like [Acanthaster planci]|uniref:Peptidase M20 domain-containing protein 2 n=1 Tax=Acanthaster planci TaxID=133434 RepID=A0A8B7XNK5_ACAPL|nr:peptidase M20 domain-containing protein 2-like [Acanthaster planci]
MEVQFENAKTAIDNQVKELRDLGHEIWRNPELGRQEYHAHQLLTSFLRDRGFEVEEQFISPTGFRAWYGAADPEAGKLHVCLLCEYDALPELGHASGRNLIAEATVAAALGIKAVIEKNSNGKRLGKITVLGCPDQEGNGTKIDAINQNFFKDVDLAMTVTPYSTNISKPTMLTVMRVMLTYHGKAAHASAQPWEGRNALDAAVLCYNNISVMRQQLKPYMQIHGVISSGGIKPNIIPEKTEMKFYLRAKDHIDIAFLQQRANAAFVAAAKATHCEIEFNFTDHPYSNLLSNDTLADTYKKHAQALGMEFTTCCDVLTTPVGSSDAGNVSHIVPCIVPAFDIEGGVVNNTADFTAAAGEETAHCSSIRVAKALALTAIEAMNDEVVMEKVKGDFTAANGDSLALTSWK